MTSLRRSLCTPIPEIFDAAKWLLKALEYHGSGDFEGARTCLRQANDNKVRAYTDHAWGKGAGGRYGFVRNAASPPYFSLSDRPKPRMPTSATRKAVIARDGYHCRFCGIPVIDPAVRKLVMRTFPDAVTWGSTNASQHAAFQCMWLQFDHVLPNSRGGDSSLENIFITCGPCNFGRMDATIEEAGLMHPLASEPLVVWEFHDSWDGLEQFRAGL
jgi:5-methylcytosine-specific restriction endonuclease McrA